MKIILVNSLANGGGERIAVNIANELVKTEPVILAILENKIEYDVDSKVEIIYLKTQIFKCIILYIRIKRNNKEKKGILYSKSFISF